VKCQKQTMHSNTAHPNHSPPSPITEKSRERLPILFLSNLGAISFNRLTTYKEKELAILSDFTLHYMEQIKGLPFNEVVPGHSINTLYDGENGAPNIRIPQIADWQSIDTADYEDFHPELVWLNDRNLEMKINLTVTQVDAEDHTKHLELELRWDAPLGRGYKQSFAMDMVRVKDL